MPASTLPFAISRENDNITLQCYHSMGGFLLSLFRQVIKIENDDKVDRCSFTTTIKITNRKLRNKKMICHVQIVEKKVEHCSREYEKMYIDFLFTLFFDVTL